MDCPKAIRLLLLVLVGYLSSPINAQFNIKTGYNLSLLSDPGMNQAVHLFQNAEYKTPFRDLSWLHGIEVGMRYRNHVQAIELSYQGGYQRLQALGTHVDNNANFTDKIRLTVHSACVGYQLTGDVVGVGAEWQFQWYQTKAEIFPREQTLKHVQSMNGYSVFMLFTLSGRKAIDMVLKPYLIIPDKPYNLDPLIQYSGAEIHLPHKKWTRFGISVLFYNGGK